MPRTPTVPTYRLHAPSGQAVVTVRTPEGGRRDVYLGTYNTPVSRQEYARIVAELATAPAGVCLAAPVAGRTVNELLLPFWEHVERHYRRADDTPTNEVTEYRVLIRDLRALYGHTLAREFGPLALKALRGRWLDAGLARTYINQRVGRVRRLFKWAAGEELVPFAVYQSLTAVSGLQKGRTTARETEPVGPVAEEHVRATLPFVRPAVRAMAEVQLLTGMRPGELVQLRPCDLDTSGDVWVFRPEQHKNAHRGKARAVPIGPRARAILERFAPADPTDYYFSPRRVVAALHAERRKVRGTPLYRSHAARYAAQRTAAPKRAAGRRYTTHSYGVAVSRAVRKANERRERLAGPGNFDPVAHWHPNQIRHAHGTEVRRLYGLEAAQVALGHARADVTELYAERNLTLAAKVAAEIG
ncbi:tyrosine-type recombinase/integrase [Urbifossiella limnaea]|uniref:Tyrosine recombinase XerC n=1 Tax=Urbifossiella limnaea TaxID=2528023 RepID=A0A517XX72_9BACT|nr:site-specific integrase [Urbifossiella limnaea]QDU22111.1 Tyrosine recombinase XerC [Urbifossiella limnaea]